MRKHFLILMLLALLPLAGLAQTFVRVIPSNVSKYYGQKDADITLIYDVQKTGEALGTKDAAILRAGLQIQRNGANAGEKLGDYTYTMTFKKANADAKAVAIAEAATEFTTADVTTFVTNFTVGVNGNGVLSIEAMPLDEDVEVADIPAQIHTGSAVKPALTITNKANGEALEADKDYTVDYSLNIDPTEGAQTAVATITGMGNYAGSTTKNFAINADMSKAEITINGVNNLTYDGNAHVPNQIIVKVGEATLTENTHYTLAYTNSNVTFADPASPTEDEILLAKKHAGTVTMTFTGKDAAGYTSTKTATYTIKQKAVTAEEVSVSLGANPVYSGDVKKPAITEVTINAEEVPTTDYVITATAFNAGAATATLTLNEKSNFTLGDSNKEIAYTINKKELIWEGEGAIVATLEQNDEDEATELNHYTWTNADIKPVVTLVDGTKTIDPANYTVTYTNGNNSAYTTARGKKWAVVKANTEGNYSFANKKLEYRIDRKPLTIKVKDFSAGYATEFAPELEFGEGYIEETPEDVTKAAIIANAEWSYVDSESNPVGDIDEAAPGVYTVSVSNTAELKVLDGTNADNYEITWTPGTLTKTAGQVLVQIENNTAEYGDAFPVKGWTVSYVSGLSAVESAVNPNFDPLEDPATTTMESILKTVAENQNKFAMVTPGFLDVNAEGYEIKYDNGIIANPNYVVTAQNGKLIVGKKHITAAHVHFNDGAPIKYSGVVKPQHVDVSPSKLFPGHAVENDYLPTNYYETVFDEDVNAGSHEAQISMKGAGTEKYITETEIFFTQEEIDAAEEGDAAYGKTTEDVKEILPYITAEYLIAPLAITITADDFTGDKAWTYGTKETNYTAKVSATVAESGDETVEADKLAALVAGEQPEGFNGKLVVKRVNANGVGTWNEGLVPMIVDAEGNQLSAVYNAAHNAADNYNFTFVAGKMDIVPGTIFVKAKDVEIPYGEAPEKLYLDVVSGMEYDPTPFEEIATYSRVPADFGYDAENFKARGTYTLNYKSTALAPTATNYIVKFADDATGTLEVTKRPVKIEIKNFVSTYENLATFKEALATVNETKNFDPYAVISDDEGFYGLTDGNKLKDLFTSVNLETENVGDNAITATAATEGAALNYVFTIIPGTLTITSEGVPPLVLNRVAKASYDDEHANTAAKLITENNGKFVNVKFSDFNMYAEKWYPLVLPFATTVKKISESFGYAVVNTFEGTDANGNIQFKLAFGAIPANTPFIVKIYENKNMKDVTFANAKIEKAHDANGDVKIGDASGVQFVGTYKGRVEGFRSYMYYFSTDQALDQYYKGNDTNKTYLRPLGAYFVDNASDAANNAREILIQEADGSTTAISAIEADGSFVEANGWYTVGGVKLESVPTEKGVYIRNGKKVVIK